MQPVCYFRKCEEFTLEAVLCDNSPHRHSIVLLSEMPLTAKGESYFFAYDARSSIQTYEVYQMRKRFAKSIVWIQSW